MILGILLVIIFILYFLLVKGVLWRMSVATFSIFAFIGMKTFLLEHIASSQSECLIIAGHSASWAEVVPCVILILAAWLPKGGE